MSTTINAVPIKYVGGKVIKTDAVNYTGTQWLQGQTLLYPADRAAGLLRHPSVWQLGDIEDVEGGMVVIPGSGNSVVSIDPGKIVQANPINVPGSALTSEPDDDAKGSGTGIAGSGTGDDEDRDKTTASHKPDPGMLE